MTKQYIKDIVVDVLLLHVDRYDSDSKFSEPFAQNGCWFATDKYTAISIPESLVDSLEYHTIHQPEVTKAFPKCLPTHSVSISSIKDAIDETNIETLDAQIVCPDCGGIGEVEWTYLSKSGADYNCEFDCPCCGGTGQVDNGASKSIGFTDRKAIQCNFLLRIYLTMIKLNVKSAKVTFDGDRARFDLDNGVVILSMLKNKSRHWTIPELKLTKFKNTNK